MSSPGDFDHFSLNLRPLSTSLGKAAGDDNCSFHTLLDAVFHSERHIFKRDRYYSKIYRLRYFHYATISLQSKDLGFVLIYGVNLPILTG